MNVTNRWSCLPLRPKPREAEEALIAACEAVNADAVLNALVDEWQAVNDPIEEPWDESAHGEVWWVDLNPTKGSEINKKRPCVILSADILNQRRRTVVVVPLSTAPTVRPPLTVAVSSGGRPAVAVMTKFVRLRRNDLATGLGR